MATQVIPNGPTHFSPASEVYSDMYPNYSSYENFPSGNQHGYVYNTEQQLGYSSTADTWPNQANTIRRVSSRSPNLHFERTPIRHHKPSVSRSRSTSKPDALLAYATEQSLQSQPHSTATTPSIPQTTPTTSPALYHSQNFASPAINSPYVQHTQYFDGQTTPFSDMHGQTNAHAHSIPEYFTSNRTDMHVPSVAATGLTPQDALYLQSQTQARSTGIPGMAATAMGFQPMARPLESTPGPIEVSSSRNKPQCWEHGCNGRQFSTFSNLLRHQREKSGTAAKARCPHCGTEFTRTTARNGHMYGGKCKGMPDAARRSPSMGEGNSDTEGAGRY